MKAFIKDILDKNELVNFVAGYPEYRVKGQGQIPTDTEAVIEAVKDELTSNTAFREKFLNTVIEVAKLPEYGWTTLYYLLDLYWCGKEININLVPAYLIEGIADSLRVQKEGLEKRFDWEGENWPNGIWGNVQRMNRNIHESIKITVLPEEL